MVDEGLQRLQVVLRQFLGGGAAVQVFTVDPLEVQLSLHDAAIDLQHMRTLTPRAIHGARRLDSWDKESFLSLCKRRASTIVEGDLGLRQSCQLLPDSRLLAQVA